MVNGAVIGVGGIIVKQISPDFCLTGQEIFFIAMVSSIAIYIIVSLLSGCKFDLNSLLHKDAEQQVDKDGTLKKYFTNIWTKFITKEFTKSDKMFYAIMLIWMVFWTLVFIAGVMWNFFFGISDSIWLKFWHIWIFSMFGFAVIVAVWLAIGGFKNLIEMFRILGGTRVDVSDDGWVKKPGKQGDVQI